MGPDSKRAVERILGHLIDELQLQRAVLNRIDGRLARAREEAGEDIATVQRRLSAVERDLRGLHGNGSA